MTYEIYQANFKCIKIESAGHKQAVIDAVKNKKIWEPGKYIVFDEAKVIDTIVLDEKSFKEITDETIHAKKSCCL